MIKRAVVVGVDGKPGASPALDWAAAHAVALGCELLVLHATHDRDARLRDSSASSNADQIAMQLVNDAAAGVRAANPDLEVRSMLSQVGPVEALVEASQTAEVVVIGNNGLDDLALSIQGTVGHRVSAHARCPVVVVPAAPADVANPRPMVVVGIAATCAGRLALRAAFDQARLYGYSVTGIRANTNQLDSSLASMFGIIAAEFPDVAAEVIHTDDEAPQALLAASRTCCLLVLGCHHSDEPWTARLGAVPASLIGRLNCPLLLVGQGN